MKKDISIVFARILLKNAGKEDVKTFTKWKNDSDQNSRFAENFEKFWNEKTEEKSSGHLNAARERLLSRLNMNAREAMPRSFNFYLFRIAASVAILLSLTFMLYKLNEINHLYKNNWVEISTEPGQQSKVILSDGSLVWLNAETVLKYAPNKKERRVILDGEAYFEVNHSADYPFVVEAGDVKVRVMGTKFNVSHYANSNITETSLLSGKVAMTFEKSKQSFELAPGEKATYNIDKHSLVKAKVDVAKEVQWRQNVLYFDNEPFDELILKLEKYYAVKFIYDKEAFKNIHYTGTIDNLSINKVLEYINFTIPVSFQIDNKVIKLKPKK